MPRVVTSEAFGPQREFLDAILCPDPTATSIGYGGARGGGKSYATAEAHVLVAAAYPGVKTLILRSGTEDVIHNYRDQINACARRLGFGKAYHYLEGKHYFRISNGSRIRLGFIKEEKDYNKYLGHEYGLISLTEASEHVEKKWDDLGGSNRAGISRYVPRMTLDTNPGGIGNDWINQRFGVLDPKTRREGYKWIPAYIWDCPANLIKNPNYIREKLLPLPPWQRKQWLFGRFDALSGQYFVIPPWLVREAIPQGLVENADHHKIAIPKWATWTAGVDYGNNKPFGVLYSAKWKDLWTNKQHIHFVSEIYEANLDMDEQAGRVVEKEQELRDAGLLHGSVLYYADPSVFNRKPSEREEQNRTIADVWKRYQFYVHKSRSNNRIAGWKLMKMLLRHEVLTIDDSCKAFLNEATNALANGAPGPPTDEDIQQGPLINDHLLDCARYDLLSIFRTGFAEPMIDPIPIGTFERYTGATNVL